MSKTVNTTALGNETGFMGHELTWTAAVTARQFCGHHWKEIEQIRSVHQFFSSLLRDNNRRRTEPIPSLTTSGKTDERVQHRGRVALQGRISHSESKEA